MFYFTDPINHRTYSIVWRYRLVPNEVRKDYDRMCLVKVKDLGTDDTRYMGSSVVGRHGKDESRIETLLEMMEMLNYGRKPEHTETALKDCLLKYAKQCRGPKEGQKLGPCQRKLMEVCYA